MAHRNDEAIMRDAKLFIEKCYEDHAWCANFADTRLSKMQEEQLVKLNCGHRIVKLHEPCEQSRKNNFKESCAAKLSDETAIRNCIKKDIVTVAFQGCLYGGKSQKRDAPLSGDTTSSSRLAFWGTVGFLVFLLLCALIAYVKGSKKGRKSGASKSGKSKSKMTTGKSNLGSLKSQTPSTSSSSRQGSKK